MIAVPAKTFSLIAYLLLTSRGEPANRASLWQFLWGNADSKTAATNLRKFLLRVRKRQDEIGFGLVRIERSHVELAPLSGRIDLLEFQHAISAQTPADLVSLCDLYRGDLLEGFEEEEAEFGAWLETHRANLRDAFVSAVASRIEPLQADADRVSLKIAARRLIEVDPYNEAGHRALMRLFAEDGEPARVRDIYHGLEFRLRQDLGVESDSQTTDLYYSLLPSPSAIVVQDATSAPVASVPVPRQSEFDPDVRETIASANSARSGTPRIIILPPAAASGPDYRQQLATSLIEDVTLGLCRFKALSVIAPHTAWELSQDSKKALLRTFRIDYAVETQLQGHGTETQLAVRLINAVTRDILWIEQFAFDAESMAHHYKELSVQIVLRLVDTIERTELASYDAEPNDTAYHLYLDGQRNLRTLGLPSVRRARKHFKSAVSACADFVPAISGLARTYQQEWLLMASGDHELLGEAERLAILSRDIDPDDARGYRELGVCRLYGGRFDESIEALAQAEKRSPQFADLLNDFADAYSHTCDFPAALQKITKAIELNPLCPDYYWWTAAGANYHLQQYRDAIRCMNHMRDQSAAYRLMAASYGMLGEREKARMYARKTREIHPDFSITSWLSIVPIQDPYYAKHYEQGLREAGFN